MTFTLSGDMLLSLAIVITGLGVGWGIFRGAIISLVERVEKLEAKHDTHVEKVDKLCTDVSALVARLDMLFSLGRQDALVRRNP